MLLPFHLAWLGGDNPEGPARSTEGWGEVLGLLGGLLSTPSHLHTPSHTEATQGSTSLLYLSQHGVQGNVSTGHPVASYAPWWLGAHMRVQAQTTNMRSQVRVASVARLSVLTG